MNKRPRIHIERSLLDYFVEALGAVGLFALIALPIYFYRYLPAEIPTHFNALGEVDAYGSRGMIWLLPGIGLLIYLGLTILNRYPHHFNYLVKVTESNAARLYTTGTRIIRLTKVVIVLLFAFMSFKTIEIVLM